MLPQPIPANQRLNASHSEAVLRTFWLEVVGCLEMVCTDGLWAYVLVANHK
jgi:hypothetical protein